MALRLRRSLTLLVAVLVLPLAACGEDGAKTATGADAFELTNAEGEVPEVEWNARMEVDETDVSVLAEGDGAELAEGDRVMVNLFVSNGFTHRTNLNTYGADAAGASVVVGKDAEPRLITDLLMQPVGDAIEAGDTVGTRKQVTLNVGDELGDHANQLGQFGIGNQDGLLIVFDIVALALDGPQGAEQEPPAWAPRVVEKKGTPTELDFSGAPEPAPNDDLRVATLVEGDGATVEKGDAVAVKYLGQVYGAKKPFDENFSGSEALDAAIGKGVQGAATPVIPGWGQGLAGTTVGSRVIIQIPPRLGYGSQGNKQAGIGGKDTIYFLVDVLGAA